MSRWFVLVLLMLLAGVAPASPPAATGALSAEQATRDLRVLERVLRDLHPGLTRYGSQADLDRNFADARAAVADGSSDGQMYLLASRLAASVRCGHTWTNPLNQAPRIQAMLDGLPALPVDVRLAEGRLLVTASANPALAAGTEILSVDDRSVPDLVAALLPYLRADGSSDGKRLSQLDSSYDGGALDRLLPLVFPPRADGYRLSLRRPDSSLGQQTVAAMAVAQKRQQLGALAEEDRNWRLEFEGDVARLTLPTFAFWNDEFDWKRFLANTFDTLAERKTRALVLDLRQNEGGDSAIGQALLAYLVTQPYRVPQGRVEFAYERAPYDVIRYLDTWDYGFFDRTGRVAKDAHGRWHPIANAPSITVLPVQAQGFRGRTVLLTGPRMSSSGFLFARDAQASGAATLVGQATGGNRRGLNGGELAWVTLPNSGVSVDIPLLATIYDGAPDAGVAPDIGVPTTLEDIAAGRDPDWDAARAWLATP